MENSGFDLSTPHIVEFNVDFDSWPPPDEAISLLRTHFGTLEVLGPEESGEGYVQFRVRDS